MKTLLFNRIQKKTFLIIGLLVSIPSQGQIISQYVETDSGTSPKGIEIWNNTGATLDFSVNNLVILKGSNGGTPSPDATISSGMLASGDVMVIGTTDIGTYLTNQGLTSIIFVSESFTFNGDDALVVQYGATQTDVIGTPGSDPGSEWAGNGVSTKDQNIELNGGISSGSTGFTDPSTRFSTVSIAPSGAGGLAGFGVSPGAVGNPGPLISNISQTPSATNVTSTDAVSVSAEVTDSDGVASVSLNWGLASGSLSNSIAMFLGTGSTYSTNSSIPAQANGTTVYYEITATDSNVAPATTTSAEQSYNVVNPQPGGLQVSSADSPYIIDFETTLANVNNGEFAGTGFLQVPSPGQLDSDSWAITGLSDGDLAFGGTATSGDYTNGANNGGPSNGGIYAFKTYSGNSTLGFQATGSDFSPGSISLKIQNQTGTTVTNLKIAYDIFVLNNDTRANSFNFSHSTDDITYTNEASLDFVSMEAADTNPSWKKFERSINLSGLSIAPGSFYYLKWSSDDVSGGGSRDEFALDNIKIIANEAITNYVYNGTSWSPSDPSGTSTAGDNITVQSGNPALTADTETADLTINAGAVLDIEGVLTINNSITNNGRLVFISDGTKLGQLGEFTGTISGTGDVRAQRYIPASNRAFRFVSSPVTTTTSINANWQEGVHNPNTTTNLNPNPGFGTHISGSTTGTNGFDATVTGNPSLFDFDNPSQMYNNVPNTDVLNLVAGKAYLLFVRGDRGVDLNNNNSPVTSTTLRTTGSLFTGNYTDNSLSPTAAEYSLVGNPYQAIVDMNDVLENSTNLNSTFYYVWDPHLSSHGAYVLINLPSGSNVPVGSGSSDANEFMQPGQSVFVSTLANGPATVLIEETDKNAAAEPTSVFKPQASTTIAVNLYEAGNFANAGPVSDGFLVKFSAGGNNGLDYLDAVKFPNPDENVGLLNGSDWLIMENRASPTANGVLQFQNNNYRYQNYVYEIENGLTNVYAYLEDAYLGTQTFLPYGTSTINFSVDPSVPGSIAPDRFSITFQGLSTKENSFQTFETYPNPVKNGVFYIKADIATGEKMEINLYDLLGRRALHSEKEMGIGNQIQVFVENLNPGVYILEMKTNGKTQSKKIIVQ